MYYRDRFVTNSSSTCFIAYGVRAEAVDQKKFGTINEYGVEEHGSVAIATSCFDEDAAIFYIKRTEQRASEYNTWQSVEPETEIDEHLAGRELQQAVEDFGCKITEGPFWGFFNSGH